MEKKPAVKLNSDTKKDDLIVIAGAGGFIAGALIRYFHEQGFTRIRAIDKKPLPDWYHSFPPLPVLTTPPFHDGLAKAYTWIEKQYADRKMGKQTLQDYV